MMNEYALKMEKPRCIPICQQVAIQGFGSQMSIEYV